MDACSQGDVSASPHHIGTPGHGSAFSSAPTHKFPHPEKLSSPSGSCHTLQSSPLSVTVSPGSKWVLRNTNVSTGPFSCPSRSRVFLSSPAGYISAEVAQSPSHRVIEKKQAVNLSCDPISGHDSLFWYYHAVGREMKLLIYSIRESVQDNSGTPKGWFKAERTEGTSSTLRVTLQSWVTREFISVPAAETRRFRAPSLLCKTTSYPLLSSGSPGQKSFSVLPPQGREEGKNWNQPLKLKSIFKIFNWGYLRLGRLLWLLIEKSIYANLFALIYLIEIWMICNVVLISIV